MKVRRPGFVLTGLIVRPDPQKTTGGNGVARRNPEHGRDGVRQPVGQIKAAEFHRVGASIVELDPIVIISVHRILYGASVLSHDLVDHDSKIWE